MASARVESGGASWVRFSTEGVIWPRSMTVEWRERERERVTAAGARCLADWRWVGEVGLVVVSGGCASDCEGPWLGD